MKTFTMICIVVIPAALFALLFYYALKLDLWRQNLKAGDRVIIFIGEDSVDAVVHIRYRDFVDVITVRDQEIVRRYIYECY